MLADDHRTAAEDIETSITSLSSVPRSGRIIIEGAWGAAFHWIAYGCATKHNRHQESHARLGSFLRSLGESQTADTWERLDSLRQGGWYGTKTDPLAVSTALSLLQEIHTWATS
jgi:hypothetical protein